MTPIRRSLFLLLLPGLGLRANAQASGQPVEISIRRSACFGTCPIYDFVLTRAGRARYHGVQWTTIVGRYRTTVDSGSFVRLAKFITDQGFLTLDTTFIMSATDMPTTITCLRSPTGSRCIRHYGHEGPQNLYVIENAIDSVAARLKWSIEP